MDLWDIEFGDSSLFLLSAAAAIGYFVTALFTFSRMSANAEKMLKEKVKMGLTLLANDDVLPVYIITHFLFLIYKAVRCTKVTVPIR